MIFRNLRQWLKRRIGKFQPLIPQGYAIEASASGGEYAHTLCGPQAIPGAACPNCARPLLCQLNLDLRDPRLGLQHEPFTRLPLLYCWTCNIAYEPFFYRLRADHSVTLLQYGRGRGAVAFTFEQVPVSFPEQPVELVPVSEQQMHTIACLNRGETDFSSDEFTPPPEHQVGGFPLLEQGWEAYHLHCPACRRAMPFLAVIRNGAFAADIFTHGCIDIGYSYCPGCRVVGAVHNCD